MKHAFTSGVGDSGNSALVDGPKWNALHIDGQTSTSSDLPLDATHDYIRATGGSGAGITITLPTAVGCAGRIYKIKKIDSGVGPVGIATTSSQNVDGQTTYTLANQFQYVIVESNGTDWDIIGQN